MGGGGYSFSARSTRSSTLGYDTKSTDEIFISRKISSDMDPRGVTLRESCDSEEHPETTPLIIGLDVTASMGTVPHHLIQSGLPNMMKTMLEHGVSDPQVLFMGIGDHLCDASPLQIGQFESSDDLLDRWLTEVWLEEGGGGNGGESYMLAWFFASRYTELDCFTKRGKKGFLFTIGDEPVHKAIAAGSQKDIMGGGEYSSLTSAELLKSASEKYNVYHIHMTRTYCGGTQSTIDGWKELIGDHLIIVEDESEIPKVISKIVVGNNPKSKSEDSFTNPKDGQSDAPVIDVVEDDEPEIML
jgi:hypothetical protein